MDVKARPDGKERKQTPINWKVIIVTFTIMFSSSVTITMVFPFLPWMVRRFKIRGEFVTVEETGYYVGLVATAYFIGRFVGSYFWGVFSDKKGRRPTLILSGVGITVFTLLFGFTNTTTGLAWALVMRFFSGAANGAVGTAKAVVSDVSDDTNQGKSLVVMTLAFSSGLTVGPALGGALAEPVHQYPDSFQNGLAIGIVGTFKSFLEEFPYFLPCFVISILAGIGTLVVYCKLPETGKNKHKYDVFHNKNREGQEHCSGSVLNDGCNSEDPDEPQLVVAHYNVQQDGVHFGSNTEIQNAKIHGVDGDCTIGDGELGSPEDSQQLLESIELEGNNTAETSTFDATASPEEADYQRRRYSVVSVTAGLWMRVRRESIRLQNASKTAVKKSKMWQMLKSSEVRRAIGLYCMFSFGVIGSDEIYSLWLSTQPYRGGLGFSERNIGISLAVISSLILLTQVLLVAKLEKHLGSLELFNMGCIVVILTITLLPTLASVTNDVALWALIIVLQLPYRTFVCSCFVMTALFINNSVPRADVGTVNGLAVSATAITRAASPSVSGSLFAWSTDSHLSFPFDEHFIFYVFGIIFMLSLWISISMPDRLRRQKIL